MISSSCAIVQAQGVKPPFAASSLPCSARPFLPLPFMRHDFVRCSRCLDCSCGRGLLRYDSYLVHDILGIYTLSAYLDNA